MQISTSRFHRPSASMQPKSQPSENFTFHNEPHVPMDAVMRGFNDPSFDRIKAAAGNAVIGAVGGAVAGSIGNGGWMIPANIAVNAGLETAATAVDVAVNKPMYGNIALMAAPIYGATTGFVSGSLGFALSALTGLDPTLSGALAGGVTGAVATFT